MENLDQHNRVFIMTDTTLEAPSIQKPVNTSSSQNDLSAWTENALIGCSNSPVSLIVSPGANSASKDICVHNLYTSKAGQIIDMINNLTKGECPYLNLTWRSGALNAVGDPAPLYDASSDTLHVFFIDANGDISHIFRHPSSITNGTWSFTANIIHNHSTDSQPRPGSRLAPIIFCGNIHLIYLARNNHYYDLVGSTTEHP